MCRLRKKRRGAIAAFAAVTMVVIFGFIAFGVDTGLIVSTKTKMQNAVDAAALAAAQEITSAVTAAAAEDGTPPLDASSIAVTQARAMAAQVAEANGVTIDPDNDVEFGRRTFDEATGEWPIVWGSSPYNVVRVTARKTNDDPNASDAKLKLAFGWAVGKSSVAMQASASAFVQARDLVVVLDYSSSMRSDSLLTSNLGLESAEDNLDAIWDKLVLDDPRWPDTNQSKFTSSGFAGINSYAGTYNSSSDTNSIFEDLGLDAVDDDGNPLYPFPQSGAGSDGVPNDRPSASSSAQKWKDYISYTKNMSGSYKKKYGYRTLMNYLLKKKYKYSQSEDLWRTPHYPFHAMKDGVSLLTEFLDDLEFGDELGMVTYDSNARAESVLNDGTTSIDLSNDPITNDYEAINTIQRHKQAAHYSSGTGMGYGIKEARTLLTNHARYGSRPTILVITDGRTNKKPSGWSLPSNWNWDEVTDFDGDGNADYTTSDSKKQYAFWEAHEAVKAGFTVHTMSVGATADAELMDALAKAGGGIWINVPGGTSIESMSAAMLDAFSQIAANVPPARLIYSD